MIAKDDMMGVLLDACPSFPPQGEAFQDEWREQADDLPLYLVLGNFARQLIDGITRAGRFLPRLAAALLHVDSNSLELVRRP
jgi:hypothetical protein